MSIMMCVDYQPMSLSLFKHNTVHVTRLAAGEMLVMSLKEVLLTMCEPLAVCMVVWVGVSGCA